MRPIIGVLVLLTAGVTLASLGGVATRLAQSAEARESRAPAETLTSYEVPVATSPGTDSGCD